MKLFFNSNKEKLTIRKPKEDRSFIFTDKSVREYDYAMDARTYSDKICKGLKLSASCNGNHNFFYCGSQHLKVIGSIYNIGVDKAREICNNIKEHEDEFNAEFDNIKLNLYGYFQKYGPYPHKKIETVTEDTEEDVQEQIKSLQKQVETLTALNNHLYAENDWLWKLMDKIRESVPERKENEDDND